MKKIKWLFAFITLTINAIYAQDIPDWENPKVIATNKKVFTQNNENKLFT